jgi:cytochrome c-type biogenesis protein CcmH/NrfG
MRILFSSLIAFVLGLAIALPVAAQYQSESRIITGPIEDPPSMDEIAADAKKQLRALDDDPYGKSLLLQQLAAHAITSEKNNVAITYYEELLKLRKLSKPALLPARYNLAQLYFAAGDYKKTTYNINRYFRAGGRATAKAWVLQGSAYVKLKRYRLAQRPLESAIDTLDGGIKDKKHEDWFRLLLAVYLEEKKQTSAIKLLKRMVRNFPENMDYWVQLSAIQVKLRQKQDALATIELAHRSGVFTQEDDYQRFARLFMYSGTPYFGASLLERWMKEGKLQRNATNMTLLAQAWMQAREERNAIDTLKVALQLNSRADQWMQLGQLQIQLRMWSDAEKSLRTALRGNLGKQTGNAWVSLGLTRYQLRNMSPAQAAFEQAGKYSISAKASKQWLKYLEDISEVGFVGSLAGFNADSQMASEVTEGSDTGALFAEGSVDFDAIDFDSSSIVDLTPVGAERQGNRDGTIPPWKGGLKPGEVANPLDRHGWVADPFADEKPLYVIDKNNLSQYTKNLSAGHQYLLQNSPGYKMPVYKTHRVAGYPQEIYDATLANDGVAKLVGSDALRDASLGFPFRKPQHGAQAMWNHRVRYRGDAVHFTAANFVVRPNGVRDMSRAETWVYFNYGNLKNPVAASGDAMLLYFMSRPLAPISKVGSLVMSHDTIDTDRSARKLWFKPVGFRLLRAPSVGYDFPDQSSDGIAYIDQIDMYNGAFDRYDWKIIGKREMVIPYNAYKLNSKDLAYAEVVEANHPNTDLMRYEIHRVWVIEASKRSGASHHFRKRRFYLDEDTWGVVMADNYNATNRLWKFQEGHSLYRHQEQATVISPQVVYDLTDMRYFISGLTNEESAVEFNTREVSPSFFTTSTAKRLAK